MSLPIFHQAQIGGQRFEALLTREGPVIQRTNKPGSAPLGGCVIACRTPSAAYRTGQVIGAERWWIAQPSGTPLISLKGLGDAEREQLSREFGIPFADREEEPEAFFDSPAFNALSAWVQARPHLALLFNSQGEEQLPDWYAVASHAA